MQVFCLLFCALFSATIATARDAKLTIHPTEEVGKVNPWIFGNNQLAYQDAGPEYARFGSGLWDPDKKAPVPEYVELNREAGVTVQRWPGGCTAHHYNWKNTIGPLENRPNDMLWGLPEFMTWCEVTNSIPLITLAVYWGNAQDAADIVEYLNAPDDGKNPNGGIDYAALRSSDGHPEPYKAVWFEYGNEDYHGDHGPGIEMGKGQLITATDYAQNYLKYQAAMKAVDPDVKLQCLLQSGWNDWNRTVLGICGQQADAFIDHVYCPNFYEETTEDRAMLPMLACLASGAQLAKIHKDLLTFIRQETGREDIPMSISEYNGHFVQSQPVPLRQALGNALRNAQHLNVMMQPENQVLMANFWQFANEYWGMATGYPQMGHEIVKQANFFVYQLYQEHFGDTLVKSDVQCEGWDYEGGCGVSKRDGKSQEFKLFEENLLPAEYTWDGRSAPAEVIQTIEGNTVNVEFLGSDVNYYAPRLELPAEAGFGYRVTALVKTENLTGNRSASIQVGDARGWTVTQSCSMTEGATGTTDWKEVVVDYETLKDTTGIEILARRLEGSKVSGKAWYKLVSVQKFSPANAGAVPDINMNAARKPDGTITLMLVNTNPTEEVMTHILGAGEGDASAWLLSGPSLLSHNTGGEEPVRLTEHPVSREGDVIVISLPAFSMAAVEVKP